MPTKVNKAAKDKQNEEEGGKKILAPGGKLSSSLRNPKRASAGTPPRDETNKSTRPAGTSPMKESNEEDLESLKDLMSLGIGTAKSDPSSGESFAENSGGGNDSIKTAIAAVRANLFKGLTQDSADDGEANPTVKSAKKKGKNTAWVHAAKAPATPPAEATKQRANFAEGTQFNEKQSKPPAKKTPGKQGEAHLFTCVVRIRIKLLYGVPEVQAAIMALLDYCLTTLQERDKHARLLSRNKTEEAFKAKDLPQDFTDFYDEWGLWDNRTQSFLNTIPEGKSRSFSASFWFKCEMLPKSLFEKTFLKMAGQKKLKGSISVEMKPCQHLDTAREIIFFQVPNCDAIGLRDMLRKAMTKAKSGMIHKYPSKYPRMEWGAALPEFEMVRDFVKNTPWRNREEKSSIQAFHKTAWHLECPRHAVDTLYTIIKVMKKNKSINKLFGDKALAIKNPGYEASPAHKMRLASAVHFHTSFQMSVNHVALRGLVNPDKEVYLSREHDEDGMEQDAVKKSVRSILMNHKVLHLSLWQCICQNDDGSWKGYYSNGLGCETHKNVAIDWGGCAAAQLRYHLLKRGVTDKSALSLIKASFSPQAFRDALSATLKRGKVVSASQAEMEDEMEALVKNTPWVDITKGMELGERSEYENEFRARASLLNPSSPEALNFEDDLTTKSINTAVAGGSIYTTALSASIGETAYVPGEVDSQESDILEESDEESVQEDYADEDGLGVVIANMEAITNSRANQDIQRSEEQNEKDYAILNSPQKPNRTASTKTGLFPQATAAEHEDEIKQLVQEWYESSGGADLPQELIELVAKSGVNLTATPTGNDPSTPSRRGKREKDIAATPTARDGAILGSLEGLRFVLSGTWPNLGGGSGLEVGKQRLKARIEQFGGRVTGAISGVTNVLVIGESPGPKKMVEALEKGVKVIDMEILNHMIRGELSLDEITSLRASCEDAPVLSTDHPVQRQPLTSTPTRQAKHGIAGHKDDQEVDHSNE